MQKSFFKILVKIVFIQSLFFSACHKNEVQKPLPNYKAGAWKNNKIAFSTDSLRLSGNARYVIGSYFFQSDPYIPNDFDTLYYPFLSKRELIFPIVSRADSIILKKDTAVKLIDIVKAKSVNVESDQSLTKLVVASPLKEQKSYNTDKLAIEGNFTSLGVTSSSKVTSIMIMDTRLAYIIPNTDSLIINSSCDSLIIEPFHVKKSLSIIDTKINKYFKIGNYLPPNITLEHVNLISIHDSIDLRDVILNDDLLPDSIPIILTVADIDLNKFIIPYDRFEIHIDENQNFEQASLLYQQLLKHLKDVGLSEKYEVQDKLFQKLRLIHDHHWFINWLSWAWWDYGYEKGRIFIISGCFFIVFFLLNIFSIRYLKLVYFPDTFIVRRAQKLEQRNISTKVLSTVYQIPGTFMYTAYLFWGLKLEIKELKLKNWWAIALILTQYVCGVVCLAYLANYVISK